MATLFVGTVAIMVALGWFESIRAPHIVITFENAEPWCRRGRVGEDDVLWVRVGVENTKRRPARGCVGRLLAVATDGATRRDVDPIQLRWAGVPRSQSFHPIDLRRGQREFLNVLFLDRNGQWHITTFEDSDFDPGFPTELTANSHHVLEIAVFSDNAETILRVLVSDTTGDVGGPQLSLRRI